MTETETLEAILEEELLGRVVVTSLESGLVSRVSVDLATTSKGLIILLINDRRCEFPFEFFCKHLKVC